MATGGKEDVDAALTSGHDVVFDWTCQCEDDGKMSEAIAYCQDCTEGFCDPCLKIHRRFPAMRNHKVLDKSQTDSWGNGAVVRGYSHPCQDHDDQTITMYCGDHDVVCCPVCVALDHKGCDGMAYIPKIAKGVVNSEEFLKTRSDMRGMIAKTKKAMHEAKKGSDVLDITRKEAIEAAYEAKQDVFDHFDKLEEEAKEEIDTLHKKLESESRDMVCACSNVCQELEAICQQTESDSSVSDSEAFVLMKMGQKKIPECQSVGQKLSDAMSAGIFKITFQANPGLQSTSIGQVELGAKESLYSLNGEYECKIDKPNENYYANMCGIYQVSNGNFIMSDQRNNALKLLSSKYNLIDCCQLPGPPSQISSFNKADATEVAVALLDGSLQFASLTNQIKLTKRIALGHKCNGLLFHDGKIYISDSSKNVYIYTFVDKKLKLLKTVKKDEDSIYLFSCAQDISIDERTEELFVADYKEGIVCLDLDGNHRQTLKHPEIEGCFTAVPDNYGNIFVIKGDNRLTQLSNYGKTVTGVIAIDAILFHLDTSKSLLYVWCRGSSDNNPRVKIFKRK